MPDLFSFRGRTGRQSWWLAHILYVVALAAPLLVYAFIMSGRRPSALVADMVFSVYVSFFFLIMLSSFFVTVQRLHDRDRSAWWWLLFVPTTSVLGRAAEVVANPLFAVILFAASAGVSIWALVELGVRRGTVGANSYGPDPLSGEKPAERFDELDNTLQVAEPLNTLMFHNPDLPVTKHKAGTTLVPKGDPAKEMFLVLKGRVGLEVTGRTVEVVGPGGIFGEMSLIDHAPPSASAVALDDTEIIPMDERMFINIIKDAPHIALDVLRIHADRLSRTNSAPSKK